MANQITIIKIRKTNSNNLNDELRWLGSSLGLFGLRDKNSSCFRVFITLMKNKKNKTLSSDEIAEKLELSRGTVVHHLNRLMSSGIVIRERGGYLLRENTVEGIIRDVRQDMETAFEELKRSAKDIDERLGF